MRKTSTIVRFALGIALCAQFGLAQSAQATKGQIGYFEKQCPDGWKEYKPLEGRVVVGAGRYIGQAADNRREAKQYRSGATGGEVQHKLTMEEMPKHDHERNIHGLGEWISTPPKVGIEGAYAAGASFLERHTNTGSRGGNQPHNNMPPYLVLMVCMKKEDDSEKISLLQAQLRSLLKSNNEEIKEQVSDNTVDSKELKKTNRRIKKLRNFVMKLAIKSGYDIDEAQKVYDSE